MGDPQQMLHSPGLLPAYDMKNQDKNKSSKHLISLAASITETLFTLGLGDRVVGVTYTCDYPSEVLDLKNIGWWFEPNL
jgi:ABC-type hemin transport system substrate-binding protein